jgi:hypothetical protein
MFSGSVAQRCFGAQSGELASVQDGRGWHWFAESTIRLAAQKALHSRSEQHPSRANASPTKGDPAATSSAKASFTRKKVAESELSGRTARLVFRDLAANRTLREIVAARGLHPRAVLEGAREWVRFPAATRLIPVGEHHLRRVVQEYVEHYHGERNHQGLGNVIPLPGPTNQPRSAGRIRRRERLGGLLKSYARGAA